jgi:hypothetical protein
VLAIDDDKAIEKFRLVDAIADTVGGEVAAKLIAKVKEGGSFGYTAVFPGSAAVRNLRVQIKRVSTQPDPAQVREFADDVRDGKFVLPIGRRMPLRDAAEAHVLGEKGGIGKILPAGAGITILISSRRTQWQLKGLGSSSPDFQRGGLSSRQQVALKNQKSGFKFPERRKRCRCVASNDRSGQPKHA